MTKRTVLLHCDAGHGAGLGHLVRSLALGEHAQARGWSATVVGTIDDAAAEAAARIAPRVALERSRSDLEAILADRPPAVLHLDTYAALPDLRGTSLLSNMQDGPYGVRPADLAIDGGFGSENGFRATGPATARLVGIDAAVIRQQVLDQRDRATPVSERPRVLVVMGGTDPQGVTGSVVAALSGLRTAVDLTIVDPVGREDVRAAAKHSRHRIEIVGFVDDLPALARAQDLIISAAGTSVWDFACMGVPMALVCVVDNQRDGYRQVVSAGLAVGLGEPPHDRLAVGVAALDAVLADREERERQRGKLQRTVDGLGAWRIVSAWEQLIDMPVLPDARRAGVTARAARIHDADLLLEWRNDAGTRAHSRSQDEVGRASHLDWLERSLGARNRRMFIVEQDGEPVGTVRWDREGGEDWVSSITIAPDRRGTGIAAAALAAAEDALEARTPVRLLADIHQDNHASRGLFARSGYLPHLPTDAQGFARYAKWKLCGH